MLSAHWQDVRYSKHILAVIFAVQMLLTACSNGFTFSTYPCRLLIDNSVHNDGTLASAMNAMSPGVFCQVVANESKKQFEFATNYGTQSVAKYNAIDERRTRALGMNNALIVGYGSLTGEFYAYDRECPNCFNPDAVPQRSRPLTLGSDGIATCQLCKRRYDMNSGGNCVSEGGTKGLVRYRASTTGPFGILSVSN